MLASSNAPRVGAPLDGTGEGIDSEGISVGRLYDEMRRLATGYLRGERAGHTLQATALVNEACVRLLESGQLSFRDREHYLATAARVMRRVLIDHARARRAEKRGGAVYLAPLTADICAGSAGSDGVSVLELDRALAALADHHPRAARLIELRVFASLTIVQAARVLEVSRKTASADLRYGRAWLSRAIESGEYAA